MPLLLPLLVSIIVFPVLSQQSIGDFCPDQLGNVWEYSWQFEPYRRQDPSVKTGESLYVKVTLNDYEIQNSDTLYIFNIFEKGIITTVYADSTIQNPVENRYNISVYLRFNVTMVVEDAFYAVMLENGKEPLSMLRPIYNYHYISSDSLEKIKFGNDSLYRYTKGSRQYVQNIGLVYDSTRSFGNAVNKLRLLSFNNVSYSSPIRKYSSKKTSPCNLSPDGAGHKVIVLNRKPGAEGTIFSPLGRRISGDIAGSTLLIFKRF